MKPFGFQDTLKADKNLQVIAEDPRDRKVFSEILADCLQEFAQTPSPDQALNHFERFSRSTFSKASFLSHLQKSPRVLGLSASIFGSIPFFSEILIRNPEYFYWIFTSNHLENPTKRTFLSKEFSRALRFVSGKKDKLDLLRIFRRKFILQIGVRDFLMNPSVKETLKSLSDLAEVMIQQAYRICSREMQKKYGIPYYTDTEKGLTRVGFTILAMGKLGGKELNFSSDIDLMYLCETHTGESSGGKQGERLPNAVYFERLSQEITAALNEPTEQGYVYRVDLRLRPEGNTGLIVTSLKGYQRYYDSRGEIWEKLSLVKARPVAGDRRLGSRFLEMSDRFTYDNDDSEGIFNKVGALKTKIDQKISKRKQTNRHVKLGRGGIREIEFIVQSFQVAFGLKNKKIKDISTLKGLKKLETARYLSQEEARELSKAYLFLRNLENRLQMVNDQQTYLLPADQSEYRRTSLRLGYADDSQMTAEDHLKSDYQFHTDRVHQIFCRVFKNSDFFSPLTTAV
ncbi:MAG: hypothetical protein ACE5FY_01155 [Nitrospiria bacterium]